MRPPGSRSERARRDRKARCAAARRRLRSTSRAEASQRTTEAADLAYGSVVTSTIAKGRIARIDTSDALRVHGVIEVLTHENRPRMASTDSAYKDDVAPDGSPFRPLYDDRVLFSEQPIALVVAEELETAQFAASLVRVDLRPRTARHRPVSSA
jgi:CO/xanthine dehydrogenase Mo-binding subunit